MTDLHVIGYAVTAVGLLGIIGVVDSVLSQRGVDGEDLVCIVVLSALMVFFGSMPFWV